MPARVVTLEGAAIARYAYRFWEVGHHGDVDVMRAVREAIFSMPNDTSAEEMRREICDRYLSITESRGEGFRFTDCQILIKTQKKGDTET